MQSNRVLNPFTAVDNLLTENTKAFRPLDPLICVSFDFLDGWSSVVRRGCSLRRGRRDARSSELRSYCQAGCVCLRHTTTGHVESFWKLAARLGARILSWNSCCFCRCRIFRPGELQSGIQGYLPRWSDSCRAIRFRLLSDILDWLSLAWACLSLLLNILYSGNNWWEKWLWVHSTVKTGRNYEWKTTQIIGLTTN